MSFFFPKAPSAPAAPPPPPMPEDPAIKQAAADEAARLKSRQGRASTILTNPSQNSSTGGKATLLG